MEELDIVGFTISFFVAGADHNTGPSSGTGRLKAAQQARELVAFHVDHGEQADSLGLVGAQAAGAAVDVIVEPACGVEHLSPGRFADAHPFGVVEHHRDGSLGYPGQFCDVFACCSFIHEPNPTGLIRINSRCEQNITFFESAQLKLCWGVLSEIQCQESVPCTTNLRRTAHSGSWGPVTGLHLGT